MNLKVIDLPGPTNRLELNKIYRVEYIDIKVLTNPYFRDHAHELYEVFDDNISIGMYDRNYFEKREDKRERIISELL